MPRTRVFVSPSKLRLLMASVMASQAGLARQTRINVSTIRRLTRGSEPIVASPATVKALARALHVEPKEFTDRVQIESETVHS